MIDRLPLLKRTTLMGKFTDMKDMFAQAREMQKQAKQIQKQLAAMRITVETGGGTVKATVDGEASLVDLVIDSSLLEPDELKKTLPKLVKKAIQEAQNKAKSEAAAHLRAQMTGFPGM